LHDHIVMSALSCTDSGIEFVQSGSDHLDMRGGSA